MNEHYLTRSTNKRKGREWSRFAQKCDRMNKIRFSVQETGKSCTDQQNSCKTSRLRGQSAQNKQEQTFRTGKDAILYKSSEIRRFVQERTQFCTNKGSILYGMARRIGKAMRQKRCGTTAGLTPKPTATAGSAAWSFQGLHLRFRCYQTFSLSTTKGYVLSKNVTKLGGRHWNMKKLCPGKAKFFR